MCSRVKPGKLLVFFYWSFCALSLATCPAIGGQESLGSIIGRTRLVRGGPPPQRVLVDLQYRGASIASTYTDGEGTFGFHDLTPNSYTVIIKDDHYEPVEQVVVLAATSMSPLAFADITLKPKSGDEVSTPVFGPKGANPNIADAREYSSHFPKQVRKEFDKGVSADKIGKREEAIKHYEKALQLAPDYYPAHNNLGTEYLSQSDLPDARKEFEEVIRLNHSDAAAYFNLSNVCMMMGQLADAQLYLNEGLRRQPDSALGEFLLGSLDLKTHKYPEAESALRQAIKSSPDMAQAHLQLVNLFLQLGRTSDAKRELELFVAKFPNSPFVPKAKGLLQQLSSQGRAATAPK